MVANKPALYHLANKFLLYLVIVDDVNLQRRNGICENGLSIVGCCTDFCSWHENKKENDNNQITASVERTVR